MCKIRDSGRIPLLVGGTMMYFRSLTEGIAELPEADPQVRAKLNADAAAVGWAALHKKLANIDPDAAARINPNDSQRIQRALEVFEISGRTMTEWQTGNRRSAAAFLKIALVPGSRELLHERIGTRLQGMFENGFVEEVEELRKRPGLSGQSPSMRAVGYRADFVSPGWRIRSTSGRSQGTGGDPAIGQATTDVAPLRQATESIRPG